MAKYILKRVLMAVITLFIVICLTFFLMNAVPGNPWLSEKTPSPATIAALNEKYGLDQPVIVQLGKYLENLAHLDFGNSIKMQKDRPVMDIITNMFPISAGIGAIAIAWAILVGVPLGCLAAYKRGTWIDSLLRVICTLGISMPGFVIATMLLHILAASRGSSSSPPCLTARPRAMCCPAWPWASTPCATCPARPGRPCWTPSTRSISRPPGPRV